MKIFSTEENKEVVYVQKMDVQFIKEEIDIQIPTAIKDISIDNMSNENEYELLRFEQKEVIEFFKGLNFIIDFDEYNQKSDEEIKSHAELIEKEARERKKSKEISKEDLEEIKKMEYQFDFLVQFYGFKHGVIPMVLPKNKKLIRTYINIPWMI